MAQATVCFNAEGDAAAIFWDRRPNDFPLKAINFALEKLYKTVGPYFYAIYNGSQEIGLMLSGSQRFDSGTLGDTEMRAQWDAIVHQNQVAPFSGDLAPITVEA